MTLLPQLVQTFKMLFIMIYWKMRYITLETTQEILIRLHDTERRSVSPQNLEVLLRRLLGIKSKLTVM